MMMMRARRTGETGDTRYFDDLLGRFDYQRINDKRGQMRAYLIAARELIDKVAYGILWTHSTKI